MGSAFSSSSSYNQYKNDFELVIRATKDLEHLLETQFDAPSGKNVGLHDKVNASILMKLLSYTQVLCLNECVPLPFFFGNIILARYRRPKTPTV